MSASHGTRKPDPATERLAAWIEPVVGAAGYDLEELHVTPAGRRMLAAERGTWREFSAAVTALLEPTPRPVTP